MPTFVECPICGNDKVSTNRGRNPIRCGGADPQENGGCGALLNSVTRSGKVKLESLKEAEMLMDCFQSDGQKIMDRMRQRYNWFRVFSTDLLSEDEARLLEDEKCPVCGENKLYFIPKPKKGKKEIKKVKVRGYCSVERKTSTKYCFKCADDMIYGSTAKKKIYPVRKELSDIKWDTILSMAYDTAKSLTSRYCRETRISQAKKYWVESMFEECKKVGTDVELEEPPEVTLVRGLYRESPYAMSPLKYVYFYYAGLKTDRQRSKERKEGRIVLPFSIKTKKGWKKMSIFIFNLINKTNRRKRRKRLKELGKITDFAYDVAKPICEGCDELVEKDHGYECNRDKISTSVGKFPSFPKNDVNLPNKTFYKFDEDRKKVKIKTGVGRDEIRPAVLSKDGWMEELYDKELIDRMYEDNTRYPDLIKRVKKGKWTEFYLLIPVTEVIPVEEGNWKHVVAYGPRSTCVISQDGVLKVRFFHHGEMLSWKLYYFAKRNYHPKEAEPRKRKKALKERKNELKKDAELVKKLKKLDKIREETARKTGTTEKVRQEIRAIREDERISEVESIRKELKDIDKQLDKIDKSKKVFRKKLENKESKRIRWLLHNEAKAVAEYLGTMPGEVTVLNMKKQPYEGMGKEELNRRKSTWNDSIFRVLVNYKLMLKGLVVKEKKFKTYELANCPHCSSELGGSWQDIVLRGVETGEGATQKVRNVQCTHCGKDMNIMHAIALNVLNSMKVAVPA